MVIKRGALLLITLFLASASLGLAYSKSEEDPLTEELDQCLDRCQRLRWSTEKVISCQGRCAHDYYEQRQEESEDEVRELDLINTSSEKSMVKECQRGCAETHPGMTKMCKQYCDQRYGPEDEDEEEQEWDMDTDTSLNAKDQKKQYKQEKCKQRCQKSKPYKQPECVEKCEKKFGEKEREEEENSRFPERKCERECQWEPRRQQGQCLKRCQREPASKWDRYESCQRRCADLGILQQVPCETRCAVEFGFRGRDSTLQP